MGRKRRSRRRGTGGHSPWLIIGLAALVVLGAFGAGVDTGSVAFTSAASDRGTSVDVEADNSGLLGLNVATSVTAGTSSRIVTVTNLVGQPVDVTVTLDGTTGTLSANQASLGIEEAKDVSIEVPCRSDAQTVAISIRATADDRFTGTATRSTSVDNSSCGTDKREVAFINENTGSLQSVTASGVVTTYNTGDIKSVGSPNADLDGDGETDVPFVNGDDKLRIVDSDGNTRTLDGSGNVESSPLGVGDYDASGTPEIYYIKNGNLFKAEAGVGSAKIVDNKNWDLGGVAGVADFDSDGALEVVFTIDKASRIAYLDDTGSVVGATGQTGKVDTLRAVSTPRDFDDDGTVEIAAYDSDTDGIRLYDASGGDGSFGPSTPVGETPMGSLDYDSDGIPDIIYLNSNQQSLHALDATSGATAQVTDNNGGQLTVTDSGVR